MHGIQNSTLNFCPISNPLPLTAADGLAKSIYDIYCKSMQNPADGQLDHTCGGRTLYFSKEAPTVQYEYVKDRFSPKDVKCISLTLPEGKMLYAPQLSWFADKILASNPARMILNRVLQDGTLTILTADNRGAPLEGSWEPQARVIRLNTNENRDRILGHLLFELCSAEQFDQLTSFQKETESGLLDIEAYAKRWGELEYQSARRFSTAVQKCIANDGWPNDADLDIPRVFHQGGQWIEWEAFWDFMKDTVHTEQYRRDWEDYGIMERYCNKNPKAFCCR